MGDTALSEVDMVSAKGSLVYEIVGEEKTPCDASLQALVHSLLNIDITYSR